MRNRLELLLKANVITKNSFDDTISFGERLIQKHHVTEASMSTLITHLAMALTRMERGEKVDKMGSEIIDELSKSSKYSEALDVLDEGLKKYKQFDGYINELDYCLLHVVTLLERGEHG